MKDILNDVANKPVLLRKETLDRLRQFKLDVDINYFDEAINKLLDEYYLRRKRKPEMCECGIETEHIGDNAEGSIMLCKGCKKTWIFKTK